MNIEIVNTFKDGIDEINYGYAVCECTPIGEAVRIDRPNETKFIPFYCPRCSKSLGIFLEGRNEIKRRYEL